jgi:small subunit ribosomal protein S36
LRRIPAVVFAGDARVWRVAAIAAIPLVALVAYYCLRPREYYTGTNSVEAYTYIAQAGPGEPVCVPGLQIPPGTARIRLQLISRTRTRPALRMALRLDASTESRAAGRSVATGSGRRTLNVPSANTIESVLAPVRVPPDRVSAAVFTLPGLSSESGERPASLCLTARGLVNWGGTPLPAPPSTAVPSVGGSPVSGRIAVWYLPPAGAERSYLSRAGAILERASLFRPSPAGPWLYVLVLLIVLPGLALAAVRCLAMAVTRASSTSARRTAAWLFAIAALNFACWALITPPFHAPDEVDHFAYTQSLVERGQAPSPSPAAPLGRWSSAQTLALEGESFFSDHQVGDTRAPWAARAQTVYRDQAASTHPSSSDGGGNETAATHGAIYYAALAPAYLLGSSSPFSQLTLMRLTSALIGALTAVFAFLLARELAPGRPWLGVLAALLVAFQPMYGFISGAVNNDVGVNAGAAALELLVILMLRRGVTWRLGLLTGGLLVALPIVKETAYSLYPVFGLALLATLYRHHRRADLRGWTALVLAALVVRGLSVRLAHVFHPVAAAGAGASAAPPEAGSVGASTSEALAHPLDYLGYLWQSLLPRLPFMTDHFPTHFPAMVIFVERGWGAFGWYDVFFPHRLYYVILAAMIAVPILGLIAARREWPFVRRNAIELGLLALMPLAVVAGFEAAFYTPGARPFIAEFGRYAFPAIAPLAVLTVASLHAFGRRWVLPAGVVLLVAMVALSYAAQLVTLTGFYA